MGAPTHAPVPGSQRSPGGHWTPAQASGASKQAFRAASSQPAATTQARSGGVDSASHPSTQPATSTSPGKHASSPVHTSAQVGAPPSSTHAPVAGSQKAPGGQLASAQRSPPPGTHSPVSGSQTDPAAQRTAAHGSGSSKQSGTASQSADATTQAPSAGSAPA